jgi:lysophospholipase L1-like esterase
MRKQNLPSDKWFERFGEWLKMQGYLKKRHPTKWELQNSEEQVAEYRRKTDERMKTDWGYLSRYAEANQKLPPSDNRIIFLGNSIIENWVNLQPDFFTKNNYIGRGISGQTSPQTLVRFRQDVVNLKPKLVIINIGTNDIAENTGTYNLDFTMDNIVNMLEIAKSNKIKVILASVLPASNFPWRRDVKDVPNKIVALNERIKQLAQKNNLIYLDYHSAMKNAQNGLNPDIAEDGVHPTVKGYQLMMPLAQQAIVKALK